MFALAVVIGLLVLSVLVLIHELGHFIAAKALKFKVSAFAVGFGRSLVKWKRGETEYRVNMIPFGGYVAMASDSPIGETAGGDNEFNTHPIWQRAVVALAGPFANAIFAIAMLWCAFVIGMDRPAYMDSTKIGVVLQGTSAETAGFLPGDSIVTVDGEDVKTWEQLVMRISQESGLLSVRVARGDSLIDLNLHIEKSGARMTSHPLGGLEPKRYPPVIGRVEPKGGADIAGLQAGDSIISIYGTNVESFDHFSIIMRDHVSGTGLVNIDVMRDGRLLSVLVPPTYDSTINRFLIGVSPIPGETTLQRYSVGAAFAPAMKKSWEYTTMIFNVLGKLTSGKVNANQLAGPLNIVPISGLMAFQGLSNILDFMALIGINLAVLNLLPLVITDGGLLVFLLIEAVRKKPLPVAAQAAINRVFVMLFIALFIFVSFNDIQRLPDFFKWTR